uniref:Uncharacterized protein n=1 Tax=Anopheles epiroticus TaxID=199890 RepID=A0A182PRA9_9DIPT
MQCIRSVGGTGGVAGGAMERKILIKSEDSRGLASEQEEQIERRSRPEVEDCHAGQVGGGSDPNDKNDANAPEVRTFVLGENQCIVYGARPGGTEGSRPPTAPSSPSSSTLQQLPISHLPPKKTLKLALGLRGPPPSPPSTTTPRAQASPPPLTLRRTSDEPDRMLARIQIVSKAHHATRQSDDEPKQYGGGGQGVHVIRDGRFYQPQQQLREDASHREVKAEEEPDHLPRGEPGTRGQYHSSIIVANGGRTSPPPSRLGRLSPTDGASGSGDGGADVQHPHTSSSITTTTTILVSNERASIYKPPTQATSTTTTVSSSKQPQQQQQQQQQHTTNNHHQHGHVTSMQPPPPPPPLKLPKGGGGHEEPSSSMPDLGE